MGIIAPMSLRPIHHPQIIEQDSKLAALIDDLKRHPRIALDTESNSLHAYREQVCLIQISTSEADFILDTLSIMDLSPLDTVLKNKKIEKILHASEYDLWCLWRDFGFRVRNLFDTRVAMRTLGQPHTGLGDVLKEEFDVKVNKRWQRADWGHRPLSNELLNYACIDTHYLIPLRDRLAKNLRSEGRWEEAKEEWERLAQTEFENNSSDNDRFWKIHGARKLTPQQAAVLEEVYRFREEQAKRLDRPPFKVFGDKTLLELARVQPGNTSHLENIVGLSSNLIRRFGKGLLSAIARGKVNPPPKKPRHKRMDSKTAQRFKRLRNWRKNTAEARQVDSDIILPRETMLEIATKAPKTRKDLREMMKPLLWRYKQYSDEILELINS
jgi:ribonuclease D